jgi:hypothetical protein
MAAGPVGPFDAAFYRKLVVRRAFSGLPPPRGTGVSGVRRDRFVRSCASLRCTTNGRVPPSTHSSSTSSSPQQRSTFSGETARLLDRPSDEQRFPLATADNETEELVRPLRRRAGVRLIPHRPGIRQQRRRRAAGLAEFAASAGDHPATRSRRREVGRIYLRDDPVRSRHEHADRPTSASRRSPSPIWATSRPPDVRRGSVA